MPCLSPAWGAETHGPLCLAALCQLLYQPLGSMWLGLFKEFCSLIRSFRVRGHSVKLLGLHLLFLQG